MECNESYDDKSVLYGVCGRRVRFKISVASTAVPEVYIFFMECNESYDDKSVLYGVCGRKVSFNFSVASKAEPEVYETSCHVVLEHSLCEFSSTES